MSDADLLRGTRGFFCLKWPADETWRRCGPPAVALGVFMLLAGSYLLRFTALYNRILGYWIISYNSPPFADSAGIVNTIRCERLGFEVYLANPCGSPLVYPPFWKLAAVFPVTSGWTNPLALGFIAIFFVALFALPAAPTGRGAALIGAAMVAPATAMGIQYGNNEMLVFGLTVLGAALLGQRWSRRRWSYCVFLLAFLLKYFPLVLMASALRERVGRIAILAGISVVVLVVFVIAAGDQLALSLANIYTMSPFSYVFGLKNLPYLLELARVVSSETAILIRVGLSVALFGVAARLSCDDRLRAVLARLHARHRDFLIVGALITVTTYLATQNVAYRQIYMLMVLPGLLLLSRDVESPRYLRLLAPLAVALMYSFPLRMYGRALFVTDSASYQFASLFGLFLREVGWMIQVTILTALLFAHFRSSPLLTRWPLISLPRAGDAGSLLRSRSG